ncbi:MAG: ROK family protein [Desulfobacterales bacterium]|nr:ROK family protein [Desulfobacterales bacterium]
MKPETYSIGIDLGGTKIEAILLNPSDTVVLRRRVATPSGNRYPDILDALTHLIQEVGAQAPGTAPCRLGIGIPGAVDTRTGLVQNANTTCLIDRPLQHDLEQRLGRDVGMENDANCFALAESRIGAGRGHSMVFGVIMGTGCGGGICIDGQVRTGPHGIAGEWGHLSVDPLGAVCYCGNRGCVETKISGTGVTRAFAERTGRKWSMEQIVSGARTGDRECVAAFDRFLEDFGRCLGGLVSILDPDAVVLGGGLSNIDELYTEGVSRVRRHAFHRHLATPILPNRLGDSAGVFGAAWIGVA